MFKLINLVRWDTGDGGGSDAAADATAAAALASDAPAAAAADTTTENEFQKWLKTQTPAIQKAYEDHTHGLTSALKKERAVADEVPALKKQLKDFLDKDEALKRTQMTKEDALAADLAKSQAAIELLRVENLQLKKERAVEREAVKLKFADPADALILLPKDSLKVGDDGVITGADVALKALAIAKPYLLIVEKKQNALGSFTGRHVEVEGEDKPKAVTGKVRF